MQLLEAYAPVDRGNWPVIWEAVAFVIEAKFPKHVEKHLDLTFDQMPPLERYRFSEPEGAAARMSPFLGGTEETPALAISAKFSDYSFEDGSEYYERVIVVQVKATVLDRTDYRTKELNRAVYVVRGEDAKSFKFGDPERLSKPIEA